jgi:hypothetical protein
MFMKNFILVSIMAPALLLAIAAPAFALEYMDFGGLNLRVDKNGFELSDGTHSRFSEWSKWPHLRGFIVSMMDGSRPPKWVIHDDKKENSPICLEILYTTATFSQANNTLRFCPESVELAQYWRTLEEFPYEKTLNPGNPSDRVEILTILDSLVLRDNPILMNALSPGGSIITNHQAITKKELAPGSPAGKSVSPSGTAGIALPAS